MDLILMRHGAVEEGSFPNDDRPLSNLGRENARRTGRILKLLGETFTHLYASPLLRARETAELVATELGQQNQIVIKPWLAHGVDAALLITELGSLPPSARVFVAGHQPDMSILAGHFLGCRGGQVAFERGSLAKFVFGGSPNRAVGVLEYLLPPGPIEKP